MRLLSLVVLVLLVGACLPATAQTPDFQDSTLARRYRRGSYPARQSSYSFRRSVVMQQRCDYARHQGTVDAESICAQAATERQNIENLCSQQRAAGYSSPACLAAEQ
ncbi:MAG: hypothetical protein H7Y37_04215 [Anaerolineae bacterium]|nr:hypothetical protein [Gloeobacterales cyanobacterium ES-bin-313]